MRVTFVSPRSAVLGVQKNREIRLVLETEELLVLNDEHGRLQAIKPVNGEHRVFLAERLSALRTLIRDAEDGEFSVYFLDQCVPEDHPAELVLAVAFRFAAKAGNRAAGEAFHTLARKALSRNFWRWN